MGAGTCRALLNTLEQGVESPNAIIGELATSLWVYPLAGLGSCWPQKYWEVINIRVYYVSSGLTGLVFIVLIRVSCSPQVIAIVMDMFTDVDILHDILTAAMRNVAVYILLDEQNAHHFVNMVSNCRVNLQSFQVSMQYSIN